MPKLTKSEILAIFRESESRASGESSVLRALAKSGLSLAERKALLISGINRLAEREKSASRTPGVYASPKKLLSAYLASAKEDLRGTESGGKFPNGSPIATEADKALCLYFGLSSFTSAAPQNAPRGKARLYRKTELRAILADYFAL